MKKKYTLNEFIKIKIYFIEKRITEIKLDQQSEELPITILHKVEGIEDMCSQLTERLTEEILKN